MENNDKTLAELIDSLNNSIEDIRKHPTKVDRIPSNLEIVVRGVTDSKAIDFLFSPKMDGIIDGLFEKIQTGDFEKILANTDQLKNIIEMLFGEGSFQGPISTAVLNNIQNSVSSYKYQTMKSYLGKTVATMKKIRLMTRNLEKGSKQFENDKEKLKKYKEAVYAIKQVLKFASIVYRNRKIINKKVYNGLNNIVHESFEYDEPLWKWED